MTDITYLIGKIAKVVYKSDSSFTGNEAVVFELEDGSSLYLSHQQDCCEEFWLEDVEGDFADLEDSPFLTAEEAIGHGEESTRQESTTWTFYKLSTSKGSVTIRFGGSSNGYYSERADVFIEPPHLN